MAPGAGFVCLCLETVAKSTLYSFARPFENPLAVMILWHRHFQLSKKPFILVSSFQRVMGVLALQKACG